MAAFATTQVAMIKPNDRNSAILVSSILLKTEAYPKELYHKRSVHTLVKMANATIKIATMTNVGRMALRRRPIRRLLKLISPQPLWVTRVVSATTRLVRAVPRCSSSCQRMRPHGAQFQIQNLGISSAEACWCRLTH
jgi:hypothetical protein